MAKQFDTGLATLIADLKSDGLLDSTLIVAMGEFGRTVGPLNSQSGRDHYLQQSALFAGGGIKGGRAIGATDRLGAVTVDPGWSKQRNIKPEDIEATIYSALGIDWTTVRHDDPLGRGFEYVPTTEGLQFGPIDELRDRAARRVEQLHATGAADAYLYGSDDKILGGLNAFYLLIDPPQTYGLPAEVVPQVPSRVVWPSSVKSIAASLTIALGAFLAFGRRRHDVARAETPADPSRGV